MSVTTRSDAPDRARARGFLVAALTPVAVLVGASAPSPFYPVLAAELGFSPLTLTVVFAVYAGALLLTLLVTGSLSDHVGRRPVLVAGLLLLATSMLLFGHAGSVTALVVARVVQGAATGLLTSTMTALVADLAPPGLPGTGSTVNSVSPPVGLALGALAGGLVLDHVGHPRGVVFGVLTAAYVVLAGVLLTLPETAPRHGGVLRSLRPRVGVPAAARRVFRRTSPALIATWATGGLYLSLGAPIVGQELGVSGHTGQAGVVTLLMGAGAAASYAAGRSTPRTVTLLGTTALAAGTLVALLAVGLGSFALFAAASLLAGTGFGATFNGAITSITPTVGPAERGELFAAVFVLCYTAFGVPAVVAGLLVPHLGLSATTYLYGAVVVVLAATAGLLRLSARE